jgi:hypothetical protein
MNVFDKYGTDGSPFKKNDWQGLYHSRLKKVMDCDNLLDWQMNLSAASRGGSGLLDLTLFYRSKLRKIRPGEIEHPDNFRGSPAITAW